jgi:2-oxoglutarate dehydrogenase E2 component (dihydrolipoamide succinyltransferase)
MSEQITVPSLGESVSGGVISAWFKKTGEYVEEGEELFELESDKATMAIPSPKSGVITVEVEEESEVEVGQVVATVDTEASAPQKGEAEGVQTVEAEEAPTEETPAEEGPEKEPAEDQPQAAPPASPSARSLLEEHDIARSQVEGSGKEGRILKQDVLEYIEKGSEKKPAATGTTEVPGKASQEDRQERRPMSRIRQKIAENLVASKQNAAHLTTFNEIDMHEVMELRKQYKDKFLEKHEVKLGFMSFFIKACCSALQSFPQANSFVDGTDIIYNYFYNIGIAVSTERGLVVPVIKDADRLSIDELEKKVADLAERAREKKLTVDEMTGGTFSITNGGIFGSLLSTPIPTPPQSAVLGMHAIKERPVAVNGEVVIRPVMYVALTYDHRVMDGREAVRFLVTVKEIIENPGRLLFNI